MIKYILENLKNFFSSRLFVMTAVFACMFITLIGRIFYLQIVSGDEYQQKFTDKIQKTISLEAARGNIYDCNGKLLAYNELGYTVTISDTGTYKNTDTKNETLNAILAELISVFDKNGETLNNSFAITYNEDNTLSYNVSGTSLLRFLADVYGHSDVSDLTYNKTLGYDESQATAEQVLTYLGTKKYGVSTDYDLKTAYEIVVMREAINENYYSRYRSTKLASDVSEETVAYINEHSDTLTGVSIEEEMLRRYNDAVYFASIIGYTGKISTDEYETYSAEDSSYTVNDYVGKTGLEQYYESYLRGINGEKQVYVNTVGKITQEISTEDPQSGNDLYLSIDADLQIAAYKLLEQEIAGIVYSNIKKDNIPIDDVYYALLNNNTVDITHFSADDASEAEQRLYLHYSQNRTTAISSIMNQLSDGNTVLNDFSEDMLDYFTYVLTLLKNDNILLTSRIDTYDETYVAWKAGTVSPKDYLIYCISQQWIDSTGLGVEDKYADTSEIYSALCSYIEAELQQDTEFAKLIYKYMLDYGIIDGQDICIALADQGKVACDDTTYSSLVSGSLSAYSFIMEKINSIEITPAQLALDPCTGSCVITDPNSGEIKALVSYPGYDNNKLANSVDAEYYESLREDASNPQWNYATQEKTAPGSTFKMITSTASLAEGIIDTGTEVECTGKFLLVDNEPECWIYPGTHGKLNVSEALRDSCNVFFYTMGYNLAEKDTGVYSDAGGINYITKYASIYGLDSKTGIEIQENEPDIATQYPVMAAIGQSDNNYTTISLSRYVTAVTSGKLYDYKLMNRILDKDGNVLDRYASDYTDISDTLTSEQWNSIHYGMRLVCENLDSFDGFDIQVAGKTGTAQQVETRPNHALFVGYAPYNDPQITIAVRISYGYSSHNAARAARNIMSYYFGEQTVDEILSKGASGVSTSANNSVTD